MIPQPALFTSRAIVSRLAFGLVAAALLGATSAHAADARPNIVVIVADDLGYGDLGIHGGTDIPTPHLDALAKSGIRCSSGYVSGPYCSPTRAALLTGRYQQRFGHEFNPGPPGPKNEPIGLSLDETTIASRLRSAGYSTALVGKWHLGHAPKFHPQQRGFDEFFGFLGGAHSYLPGGNKNDPIVRGTEPVGEEAYLTDAFAREAVSYIDRRKDQPFFLYLAFNAVHNPQHAPEDLLKKFSTIEDKRRRTYAGMLSSLDSAVGQVLAKLKESQLDEKTLVFFISDNGGPPANGSTNTPLRGQKATTWEGGIRVPFFVRWTGKLPAGVVYEQPVIQLDIFPTVLAAAGVQPDKTQLDGVDLVPYLKGDNKAAPHASLYWRFGEQTAIRHGDWKLVKARGQSEPTLYNVREDISESNDLSEQKKDVVAKLQADWDAWSKTLKEPAWGQPRAQQASRKNRQ